MVSARLSPFAVLELEASENPMTLAPKRLAALSKLRRVLVDGSKNRVATTFPWAMFCTGSRSKVSAKSRMWMYSSLL